LFGKAVLGSVGAGKTSRFRVIEKRINEKSPIWARAAEVRIAM